MTEGASEFRRLQKNLSKLFQEAAIGFEDSKAPFFLSFPTVLVYNMKGSADTLAGKSI